MAKIPFSIDYMPQIESGEYKVETKNGVSVRIICWDAKGSNDRKNIIGLTSSTLGSENLQRYDIMGHLIADSARIGNKDLLIITPEPELTDWQIFISGCLQKHGLLDCGAADRIAKECSTELLNLAREEIMDEWSKGLHDTQDRSGKAYNNGYNLGFEIGYKQGKTEILKDLPKWRISNAMRSTLPITMYGNNGMILYKDGFEVSISDLEKLPKED